MGKLVCQCGYVFDLTPSPERRMWIAIKDADFEALLAAESESDRLSEHYEDNVARVTELDLFSCAMKTLIYNCPECNRIIWYRGTDGEFEVFVPEPRRS
ncbi:MAG: hypothetical protein HY000_08225 [Planctomycetes bacterium]|nr:hypothetical protein [Planctomycetota bacterium]